MLLYRDNTDNTHLPCPTFRRISNKRQTLIASSLELADKRFAMSWQSWWLLGCHLSCWHGLPLLSVGQMKPDDNELIINWSQAQLLQLPPVDSLIFRDEINFKEERTSSVPPGWVWSDTAMITAGLTWALLLLTTSLIASFKYRAKTYLVMGSIEI